MEVSLFIDPDPRQVEASHELGAVAVELHTGRDADAPDSASIARELAALTRGAAVVATGMALHAGHGLNYQNVGHVAVLDRMAELNIGHSIISRAVFVGLERAVREMKQCIVTACGLGPGSGRPHSGLSFNTDGF